MKVGVYQFGIAEVWRGFTCFTKSVWCHRPPWLQKRCKRSAGKRTRQSAAIRAARQGQQGKKGSSNPSSRPAQFKAVVWRYGSGVGWQIGRWVTLSGDHVAIAQPHVRRPVFRLAEPFCWSVLAALLASMGGPPRRPAALEQIDSEHSGAAPLFTVNLSELELHRGGVCSCAVRRHQ